MLHKGDMVRIVTEDEGPEDAVITELNLNYHSGPRAAVVPYYTVKTNNNDERFFAVYNQRELDEDDNELGAYILLVKRGTGITLEKGMAVVFHGVYSEINVDGKTGKVNRGPDGDGDWWIDFDEELIHPDDADDAYEGCYVLEDGTQSSAEGREDDDMRYHVTPVTSSFVGVGVGSGVIENMRLKDEHYRRLTFSEPGKPEPKQIVTWEYGHRFDDGEVSPWPREMGPFPGNMPYKINGQVVTPVKRKIIYCEWEDM